MAKSTSGRSPPESNPLRPTLLDDLRDDSHNVYCNLEDLSNEASVETFFITPLIKDLGYKNSQIKTKQSLGLLTVGRGHKREKYKPDYALIVRRAARCIVDAKGTTENIDDWIEQCSGYCLALNRKYPAGENPVRLFILTNGITTKVYQWDVDKPILTLDFADFMWGNPKLERLRAMLAPDKIGAPTPKEVEDANDFSFTRPSRERAKTLFASCHRTIWTSGYGPAPAFMEFVKIMFVKLWADRQLRDNPATKEIMETGKETVRLPNSAVIFSIRWLEDREKEGIPNPLDSMIFDHLRTDIEKNIELKKKKRLFDRDERIDLRPDVIKAVVAKLQHYDMFGIDEDLNGRLFETFLSATMRGRDLGQFFTPRSVVKMMTQLAGLRVDADRQDKVIDACCGSGGFLIEALTVMRNLIRDNRSLSPRQKEDLLEKVCNECIYGIDFGKKPPLARIARINMYLHGDGGSRIYSTDGLDKTIDMSLETDPETISNLQELRTDLENERPFDVVLTNPPFSMAKKSTNETDRAILHQYVMARKSASTAEFRPSLRSSVMFLERYHDLLRTGGLLITVIDDTILASNAFGYFRDFVRHNFLIRAIISLPGDTFRRAGSRVKTSVLMLEKKQNTSDAQPGCFAFFSEQLGVDDLPPRASPVDIQEAHDRAVQETNAILSGYAAFRRGEHGPGIIFLQPERIAGRLDVKYCVPMFGRMESRWAKDGITVKPLVDCVAVVEDTVRPAENPDRLFSLIKVTYEGICVMEKQKQGKAIRPTTMYQVRKGQLIFSTIRATDGAIGIVPEELDGALVSDTSYRVFQCDTPQDAAYLWAVLRSHELRADMQSLSPGSSRYNTPWPEVGQVRVPWVSRDERKLIGHSLLEAWKLERKVELDKKAAMARVEKLGVESPASIQRWKASKAPQ